MVDATGKYTISLLLELNGTTQKQVVKALPLRHYAASTPPGTIELHAWARPRPVG